MRVTAIWFSPTLTTRKVTLRVAGTLARELSRGLGKEVELRQMDITVPQARVPFPEFSQEDVVVFGAPVYIGRMPNLIAPYFRTIRADGAVAVPVAVYGHRHYDDGLRELRDILTGGGFVCASAAAFIGEHSFSRVLAAGRPDASDLEAADRFAARTADKILGALPGPVRPVGELPGRDGKYRFFHAVDKDGKPIDIRKVKPLTDSALCNGCGLCAKMCPMGAVDPADCSLVPGICIKCGACVKRCPKGAKYFDDPVYESHRLQLEERFSWPRREPEMFF